MTNETIIWGHDYFGQAMLTCDVGGLTVGVKAEYEYGLCDPPCVAVAAMRQIYYVVVQQGEDVLSWRTVNDPLVAIALFYAMIAQMKRAQP